jgi:hypothetical protein
MSKKKTAKYFLEIEATNRAMQTNNEALAWSWFHRTALACALYRRGDLMAEKYLDFDEHGLPVMLDQIYIQGTPVML